MNLKEAFRYQNKLQSFMDEAQGILDRDANVTKVENTYLRHKVMAEAEDETVLIGQEIQYVKSYLTIQKMRYKDKLEFEINVDPSINSVHIVKLVLQPIVENAIYHGLKYKESKGMLTVNGYQKDGNAVIEIADDGVGMDEETLNRIFEKHKVNYRSNGVGVYNVQRRLCMYYGKEYGLSYKSEKGKGTTVTVVIPIEQEEHHEKA